MARVPAGKERGNLVAAILAVVLVAGIFAYAFAVSRPSAEPRLGVTFSTLYARQLGLDPRETFSAILDDLGARRIRVPVYWSEVQPEEGEFRWEETDWIMDQAARRGTEVTLAIGYKVPRWPECYIPDWAETDGYPFDRAALETFLRAAVERYRDAPALARWQVENEPYLAYGICPESDEEEVGREVELVRSLDAAHPIVMTVSGELERWGPTARQADMVGFSMYRVTWNRLVGYFHYPLPASFYWFRAWLVGRDSVMISELQAEPWFPDTAEDRSPARWASAFTPEDLQENVAFAARTGIADADLWGAEWWYYLWKNGEPGLWEEAKVLFE